MIMNNTFYEREIDYMKAKNAFGFPRDNDQFDKDNYITNIKEERGVYHLWLVDEVGEPKEFMKWFDILQNASENDIVVIHINSFGGYLHTAVQLITQIKTSSAKVICQIESTCFSAATMIALACDGMVCYPHSCMMIHTSTGGMFGKQCDVKKQDDFYNSWLEHFFYDIYRDFLTPREIESVLNGSDIWLNHEEIQARFKHKVDVFNREVAKSHRQEREHMKKLERKISGIENVETSDVSDGIDEKKPSSKAKKGKKISSKKQ